MNLGAPSLKQETPIPKEIEPVLKLEEFAERDKFNHPHYNNFYMYFRTGGYAEARKSKPYFQRFLKEHKDKYDFLFGEVNMRSGNSLQEVEGQMYEAYKILRGYGATNDNLTK